MFLADVYGAGEILDDGIVPRRLVTSSNHYHRAAYGLVPPNGVRIQVAGIDLIRDEAGEFRVLEDNLRCPSGVSYVLENRRTLAHVLPEVFAGQQVRSVFEYPERLLTRCALRRPPTSLIRPSPCSRPGVHNSAHFEHAFLARRMGAELVEGRDLFCRDDRLWMRTVRGPRPVHVIYRRIDDEFLDPVHFVPDSLLGVPGMLNAARAGNVAIANAVGNGVADDKAIYPYVPTMIDYYLGETAILPNVETYDLSDRDQRQHVLERLDRMVVKPVDGSGGYGLVIGNVATEAVLAQTRRHHRGRPALVDRATDRQPLDLPDRRRRRRGRAAARRPAPVRGQRRRRDLRAARRPHPRRAAEGEPRRELLAGRRLEGHLGARGGQREVGTDGRTPPPRVTRVRRSAVARHHAPVVADDRLRQQEGQQQQMSLRRRRPPGATGDHPC